VTSDNHNIKNINGANTLIKASHGVVTAVHVMHDSTTGDLVFRNGTTIAAPIEFTIHTQNPQAYIQLNRRFENGIFVECTSANAYALVVYK